MSSQIVIEEDANNFEIYEEASNVSDSVKFLFRYVAPYKFRIILAMTAIFLTSMLTLSLVQWVRVAVDGGIVAGSELALFSAMSLLCLASLVLGAGTYCRIYMISWVGERITADIRKAVFEVLLRLEPSYYEGGIRGEIPSAITTDTVLIQNVISGSISIALRNCVMLLGSVVFLFYTNIKLATAVFIAMPLVLIPIIYFGSKVRGYSEKTQSAIADIGAFVGECLREIKTLQAYNEQEQAHSKFCRKVEKTFEISIHKTVSRSFLVTIALIISYISVALMFYLGANDVVSGRMTLGELFSFVLYAIILASSIGSISQVVADLLVAFGAVERIRGLVNSERTSTSSFPLKPMSNVKGALSFKFVSFSYDGRSSVKAIDNLSLDIPEKSSMAIVGSSGAGKSTLFDLILRFYDPSSGSIELDGIDIKTVSRADLRDQIALVSQNAVLFTGSVMENIRFGSPDATDEEVCSAAKLAYASEFIESLPKSYDTYLGESGVFLSGGQKQRISIARAILKNPKILLLDEITSSLDSVAEREVQKAISSLRKERTTITIAHKLSTVVSSDNIVVLSDGVLVGHGRHKFLQKSCAQYMELCNELELD